ncbi:Nascent polypeptide-associated complex subunit beta [Hypoxylon texense]
MKCLPASKIPQAQGNVLHDWHAEVLAIRAFNRFVLDECKAMLQGRSSEFLRLRSTDEVTAGAGAQGQGRGWNGQPFAWKDGYRLHMYCSEAPCGDASMELIMASQEDATPWDIPPTTTTTTTTATIADPTATAPTTASPEPALPGRAYFSQLGVVRRKPARPDAPPTRSKSCSDKLALQQCASLLSSPAALLVDPRRAYLRTLVLPASRHSGSACRRAFSAGGRMGGGGSLASEGGEEGGRGGGYAFRPFAVVTTASEFAFSQRTMSLAVMETNKNGNGSNEQKIAAAGVAPSNLAVAWTRSGLEETSLGGTLQGRKQFDPRGASFSSRRRIWALAAEVANLIEQAEQSKDEEEGKGQDREVDRLACTEIQRALYAKTYGEMKNSVLLEPRRVVKEGARSEALKGWTRNIGDEDFTL